jgi:hypothetical protein
MGALGSRCSVELYIGAGLADQTPALPGKAIRSTSSGKGLPALPSHSSMRALPILLH